LAGIDFVMEVFMSGDIEAESTLTDRYQTTVPETVRRALRLGKRDKIHYTVRPGGEVVLSRSDNVESDDPALGAFLNFMANDMAKHPERLQSVDVNLVSYLQTLVGKIDIDLDTALLPEDE
jgi:antitoxin PrlF